MHWKGFAVALGAVAAGCAGTGPFDQSDFERSVDPRHTGVNVRWLEDLYRHELARPNTADARSPAVRDAADAIDESSTLDDLIAHALANHPSVQANHARWVAARERIGQTQTLPEPQISYGIMVEQVDRGGGGRDPIGHSFGVSQMFPWFGTLTQRGSVASAEAEAAYAQLMAEQANVVRDVKQAYAEYAYAEMAHGIVAAHRELLQSMEGVVRIRYRAAEVMLADLLRIEQERDRFEVEDRNLGDLVRAAASRLNAAAGRSADAPLPQARRVPEVQGDGVLDDSNVLAALGQANPELRMLHREVAGRREAIALSRLAFYPDLMVGVEYGLNTARRMARMDGGGSDTLTGMISVNLPLWHGSYEAGVREALAEFGASTKSLVDRRNTLEADLTFALYQLRDAQRRAELYGEVLRQRGEQTLEATLSAYRAGDATFTDLIQVQRELLEFELAHERALADAFQNAAAIEALMGAALAESKGSTP